MVREPFFFQAEDGIRDRNVTGVQTCALPISCKAACESRSSLTRLCTAIRCLVSKQRARQRRLAPPPVKIRSEERRVGKECRMRCSGYDQRIQRTRPNRWDQPDYFAETRRTQI